MKIIALTEAGRLLAQRINRLCPQAQIQFKPTPFAEQVQRWFQQGEPLLFICATGIVMRTLAPVLMDKNQDPPVLVLDEQGNFVIPLLSGHEGGANELARQVAELLEAQLVMTTANNYLQPRYHVGMGCERGCPMEELETLLHACLAQVGLTVEQISALSSIDIKSDEQGLIALAEKLSLPYHTWNKNQLATVDSLLANRSEYVFNTVGVYGVAESAALYSSQQQTGNAAELMLAKQKTRKATCAIARSFAI